MVTKPANGSPPEVHESFGQIDREPDLFDPDRVATPREEDKFAQ